MKLKKRIKSLRDIVKDLKKRNFLSTNALEHLETQANSIPVAIMRRAVKSAKSGLAPRGKIPKEIKEFALTLQFYSSKAYNYVRRTFGLALPHPSTIRKWSSGKKLAI